MTLSADATGIGKGGESLADWSPAQIPMIRYKGPFDWQGLYRLCRAWLESNHYKFNEKRYKHKGDEVEVDMIGERKLDEMHKYNIHVHVHIWNMRDVETPGTVPVRRVQGLLHIEIHGVVELDWSKRFEGGALNRTIYKWWKIVRKNDINMLYVEPLSIELYKFHTDIKTFLNMSTDANYYGV